MLSVSAIRQFALQLWWGKQPQYSRMIPRGTISKLDPNERAGDLRGGRLSFQT